MKSLYPSFKDIKMIGEKIIPNFINKNANEEIEYDKIKNFNLFKIPKYKEQYLLVSSMMVFNDIIFNLIILPLRLIVLFITYLLTLFKSNVFNVFQISHLHQYYLIKLFFVLSSIFIFNVRIIFKLVS